MMRCAIMRSGKGATMQELSAGQKTRRVLVTGAAGFIGSQLCERLLERGDTVLCVDNFLTGGKQNIAHLQDHASFKLMRHDVCVPLNVDVDQIYNLACP